MHWITEPRHSELAMIHLAHGSQADLEWQYCSAATLVVIPPFPPSRDEEQDRSTRDLPVDLTG